MSSKEVNMLKTVILLQCAVVILCFDIDHTNSRPFETELMNFTKVIINESEISPKTLQYVEMKQIIFNKYKNEDEEQVDIISDLPQLELFQMEDGNQVFIPNFKNLPKLEWLYMARNKFTYLKKESIGDTPLKNINIENNELSKIEKGSFGTKIEHIEMKCNKLKTFSISWFRNASNLIFLNLAGNLLTKIDPYQFTPFDKLDFIVLSYNQIVSIGEGAFTKQKMFNMFDVAHNYIQEIPTSVFSEKTDIVSIYINNNKLTFLSPELIKKINITWSIFFEDNPWQCSCWEEMKQLIPIERYKSRRDQERPVCVASLSFADHCVPFVEKELIEYYEKNLDPPSRDKGYYCAFPSKKPRAG